MKNFKFFFSLLTAGAFLTSCGGNDSQYGPADKTGGSVAVQNIMTRTSVREYTGKQVPQDTLDIILRAAMAAPSAMDLRPWTFVVVNDQNKRDALGNAIAGVGDKTKTAGAVVVVCGNMQPKREIKGRDDAEAPSAEEVLKFWVQDCSAATENLLLAVNAVGLGAVWCGVYPDTERTEEVRQILGLPEHLVPLNVIPIGYPAAIQNPKDKWNPADIITI